MAGTGPIAQAAMMEKSSEEERGRNMSKVVFVNCVGLVAGPLVGGGLGHINFRAPLAFALLLAVAAFVWIGRSRIDEREQRSALVLSWRRPIEIFLRAIRHPVIGGLALSFLLFQLGFGMYYIYIMVKLQRVYAVTSLELGLFSAVMGLGFVAGTTLGYRYLQRWLKDDVTVVTAALAACAAGICAAAAPLPQALQWLVALFACAANLPAFVGLLTLISRSASQDEQGWALGIGASMSALAFFIAGLAAVALNIVPLWALILAGGVLVALGIVPLRASRSPAGASLGAVAGGAASE
jgi:predicted MFS family arabinose efflux permease